MGPRLMVVIVLLPLVACGSSAEHLASSPDAELREAVRRTLDADSYRATASLIHGGGVDRYTIEWARPNARSSDPEGEALLIGETYYQTDPTAEDVFNEEAMHDAKFGRALVDTSVVWLQAVESKASTVTRNNTDVFAFSLPGKNRKTTATGEATVREGRVQRLKIRTSDVDYSYTYGYEDVAPITPPPEDRVVPAPTIGPTCGPDGEPPPGLPACAVPGTPPAPEDGRRTIDRPSPGRLVDIQDY